jgi:hypothetical protein
VISYSGITYASPSLAVGGAYSGVYANRSSFRVRKTGLVVSLKAPTVSTVGSSLPPVLGEDPVLIIAAAEQGLLVFSYGKTLCRGSCWSLHQSTLRNFLLPPRIISGSGRYFTHFRRYSLRDLPTP